MSKHRLRHTMSCMCHASWGLQKWIHLSSSYFAIIFYVIKYNIFIMNMYNIVDVYFRFLWRQLKPLFDNTWKYHGLFFYSSQRRFRSGAWRYSFVRWRRPQWRIHVLDTSNAAVTAFITGQNQKWPQSVSRYHQFILKY